MRFNVCVQPSYVLVLFLAVLYIVSLLKELANLTSPTATFKDLSPCDAYSVELTASNEGGESVPARETFNTSCSSVAPTTSASHLPTNVTRSSTGDPAESSSYTQTTSIAGNTNENAPTNTISMWPNSSDAATLQPKLAEGWYWMSVFFGDLLITAVEVFML